MKNNSKHDNQKGQALVTLLMFMVIVITVTAASVAVIMINNAATTGYEQASRAYAVAESGAEEGVVRLLRDTSFTGETVTVDDGTATVQVTGSGPYTISSVGRVGNFQRTIQVILSYTNNILTVSSWKEI